MPAEFSINQIVVSEIIDMVREIATQYGYIAHHFIKDDAYCLENERDISINEKGNIMVGFWLDSLVVMGTFHSINDMVMITHKQLSEPGSLDYVINDLPRMVRFAGSGRR